MGTAKGEEDKCKGQGVNPKQVWLLEKDILKDLLKNMKRCFSDLRGFQEKLGDSFSLLSNPTLWAVWCWKLESISFIKTVTSGKKYFMLLMKSSIPSPYLISFTQTPFKISLWFSFKIVFSRINTVLETGTGMQALASDLGCEVSIGNHALWTRLSGSTLNECASSTCKTDDSRIIRNGFITGRPAWFI